MDKMDLNKLWQFVEEGEEKAEKLLGEITLDFDDPIENEIGAHLNEIEYAIRSLGSCLSAQGFDKR